MTFTLWWITPLPVVDCHLILQILPADEYTTTARFGCVKLRKEESGLGSEEPISVPSLLKDAADAYPEVSTNKYLIKFIKIALKLLNLYY